MDELLAKTDGPKTKILWRPRSGRQLAEGKHPYREFHGVVRTVHLDDAIKICVENQMKPRNVTAFCSLNGRRLPPGHPCHGIQVLWFGTRSHGDDGDLHNWYGNVEFSCHPGVFLNHFKFCFLVEIMTAPTHTATRLLITNRDYSSVLPHYDPYRQGGPWYIDKNTGRHFSLEDCARYNNEGFNRHPHELEFMVEMTKYGQTAILAEAEISFRNHENAMDFNVPRVCHRFQRFMNRHETCPWALGAADASQVFFALHQAKAQQRPRIASPRLSNTAAYFRQCYMMARQSHVAPWLVLSQEQSPDQLLGCQAPTNFLWNTSVRPVLLQMGEEFHFLDYDALVSKLSLQVQKQSWKRFSWDALGYVYQTWILTHEVYVTSQSGNQQLTSHYQCTNQLCQCPTTNQPQRAYQQNSSPLYAIHHSNGNQQHFNRYHHENTPYHSPYHNGNQLYPNFRNSDNQPYPNAQQSGIQTHPRLNQNVNRPHSSRKPNTNQLHSSQPFPSLQKEASNPLSNLNQTATQPHHNFHHNGNHPGSSVNLNEQYYSASQNINPNKNEFHTHNQKVSQPHPNYTQEVNQFPSLNQSTKQSPNIHQDISKPHPTLKEFPIANHDLKQSRKKAKTHPQETYAKHPKSNQHQPNSRTPNRSPQNVDQRKESHQNGQSKSENQFPRHQNHQRESKPTKSWAQVLREVKSTAMPSRRRKPVSHATCNVMLSRSYSQTLTIGLGSATHSKTEVKTQPETCFVRRQKFRRVIFQTALVRQGSSRLFLYVTNLHPDTQVEDFENVIRCSFPQVSQVSARKYPKPHKTFCSFTAVIFGENLFEEDFVDSRVFPPPIEVEVQQYRPKTQQDSNTASTNYSTYQNRV